MITGLAGSGKSTLAVALVARTGLSIIHLDLSFWEPGWFAPSETEWRVKQRVALAGGRGTGAQARSRSLGVHSVGLGSARVVRHVELA